MAYKRKSPGPIAEGYTNASTYGTVDGTVYFDGTRLVDTATGTAGEVLTSQGAALPPVYAAGPVGGKSFIGTPTLLGIVLPVTNYVFPYGASSTTQSVAQLVVPFAGTLSDLYVNVYANSTSTNVSVTVNKNSVNTAVTTSITASTTGIFSDTTHSVAVVAGDLIQFQVAAAASGTASFTCISLLFTAT